MPGESNVEATCPECGEPITGQEGACPSCGLDFLDADGGLSQDAIDAMLADAGVTPPGQARPIGYHTPRWVRMIVALSVAVPMAFLSLFVVESVAPTPLWASVLAFLLGWMVPAVGLSRRTVPSLVVATGLLLVGFTMAVTPVLIVGGRWLLGTSADDIGSLGSNVAAAQAVFLAVGLAVVGLGGIVYRYAAGKRDAWYGTEQ